MASMTCKCCREFVPSTTFAEARTDKCSDCQNEHDRRHPRGWREAVID